MASNDNTALIEQAMVARRKERAAAAEQRREIPIETAAERPAAGFYRILLPKRFGGPEGTPKEPLH